MSIVSAESTGIARLSSASDQDRDVLPDIVVGPARADLVCDEVLASLFEATASRIPDKVALICSDRQLTYQALNQQADQVASGLISAGVRPGQIVGLWLPRGIDLLVMQLGIAKAGAAWLPFDADVPVERIGVCLDDAEAVGIVTCAAFAAHLPPAGHCLWSAEELLVPALPLRRREGLLASHPAYVIYTSGSTGKPKGIAISQASISHFLRSENAMLGVCESDRVYQGFSAAFDMSFEEIWISYLVGATLWIAPKEVATDPEVLPHALVENDITVIHTVPTLLALFNHDVQCLRLINLGGEMCPAPLVARWARPGRQVFNTYGPTEATVSASLAELHAHQPVTIGRPLPNYGMLVIDTSTENGLVLLPRGEVGELCITGPGVADGYLGRPELTAEKFLPNPWATHAHDRRLYRTGDLARIGPDGCVECLGRTDDQVKIRGFRVELGEIEAVLARQPGIGTVAVVLRQQDGIDQLVAFFVAEGGAAPSGMALRAALAASLPSYMVPGCFEQLVEMPRLLSGKIDRKALRARPLAIVAEAGNSDVPQTPAEQALFSALGKLFPGQPLVGTADFFFDLGGHSLLAARLVSTLRTDSRFAHITVRDVYQQRTIGGIAEVLGNTAAPVSAADTDWQPPSAFRRWRCGIAQAAALPGLVALRMAQWLTPFFAYHFFTGEPGDSIAFAVLISVAAFVLTTLLEFAIAIGGKWLIAGRLKPGSYPLWGLTYYRWWLADRLVESAPTYLLNGSSMYIWWLRALGAKIGREVVIGSITLRAPDLLSIGDGASIGNAVNLENARVEHGVLRIGAIDIGREACIGSCAVLEGNTALGEYGHLEGQSALGDGAALPARRIWKGSPARDIGSFDPSSHPARPVVSRGRHLVEAVYFMAGATLITTLFFLPVFPSFMLIDWIDNVDRFPALQSTNFGFQLAKYFILAFPATALMIVCTALLSALIRWTALPRLKPGSWPVHSNRYCAKWLVNQIQEASLQVLHGVYATIYAPFWYRLLGAKVGRGAEISTALGLVPDMLTLGEDTFIADAVMLGDEHIDAGWMSVQPTVISRRSFIGNGAYVPDGTIVPENVLIGVHSFVPENGRMQSGDTWLGTPAINLPAREQTSGFPEALTYRPSHLRRIGRGLIEAFRIIAPHAIVIAVGYTIVLNVMPLAGAGQWAEVIASLTIDGLLYGLGTFVFIVALKWLLMRRYRKCSVPMWTPFVWLSEAVTNMYEGIAVPNFMRYLRGTPWLPLAFNMLGSRIGKGVYLDTTDVTEFDCVTIGEYSEINALACPQTHLFEDRVMKIDHVVIGRRVYMGPRSAVLYSATIADDVRLGALTLVMKGEFIPAASSWNGCPAAPAEGATASARAGCMQ
ncbi:Pls/PosA family non-ribosomal peptide synthetase [Janthinobacterium sp. 17J80-10]|uniref:Pls/PosA family non-ribosomal peptide synthetase n=1 Tax=Janthinobacterium sp. 17J80-10 TaxID=2497863 RepID=UPI0010052C85|nr:Pls/PosA family non-ribosomal peptide synthetase [Janthinobacterium sp. 17J80-10]QAU33875.1 amino acid adenylation domain-containing protein [Janthinobacterium sp. 17J80-10]